ncbi:MAG: IS1380 family transposase [Alphaproteobacteria bacterium]|nr:IS1380 family transposase [Alphaproteobacteria bacterium]
MEPEQLTFTSIKGLQVGADFTGGQVSSDGGLMLVREVDRKLGLIDTIAARLTDPRESGKVVHENSTMLRQRVMAMIAGWEDLNDAAVLRTDVVHQVAAGTDDVLASAPTLCRFENRQDRAAAWAVNQILVEQFIASHDKAPAVLILDFDATDTPVHGNQEGRFFHGYYDCHCFLPLYVFCGDQLLTAYLRRSNIDASKHAAAILKLLVTRLRRAWPRTKLVFRGDSGFCRDLLLSWCDRHDVKYVVGIARNDRLVAQAARLMTKAEQQFKKTGNKQRLFTAFDYAAGSWKRVRWVIAKAEHTEQGSNPRFIVTNIVGDAQKIYDRRYCQRGEMENRVKEQMMLFADRVSAHCWWANQWRICLSAIAYTLMEALRRLALQGTELAQATCATIRAKLIKIGTVVVKKLTVVRLHLSSHHPLQDLFRRVRAALVPT